MKPAGHTAPKTIRSALCNRQGNLSRLTNIATYGSHKGVKFITVAGITVQISYFNQNVHTTGAWQTGLSPQTK